MTIPRRRIRHAVVALVTTAIVSLMATPAFAITNEDLDQSIDPGQSQGTGQVVLDRGHVDFGPTLNTDEWIIEIHDDTASPSYWRLPKDVVMKVGDEGIVTAPDDEAYDFLGLEPGSDAWVIPQTQDPDVVWVGWNTQEPDVLGALDLGTTLRVLGVDGPGDITVYLQSGNFGAPQPLWTSHEPFPQESWIDVNTHTHANWVFDEPGVYLVEIEFVADLIDGQRVSARDTLRFAVGDETSADEAFAATFDESMTPEETVAGPEATDTTDADDTAAAEDDGTLGMLVGVVVAVVAGALLIAVVIVIVATSRAKARAKTARTKGDDA